MTLITGRESRSLAGAKSYRQTHTAYLPKGEIHELSKSSRHRH